MKAGNPGRIVRQEILDEAGMARTVARMAAEILERDADSVMLVGIHTRGVPLADRLARALGEATGRKVAVGRLDITLYRDDVGPWRPAHQQPVLKKTVLPESTDDRVIYLVDDVLSQQALGCLDILDLSRLWKSASKQILVEMRYKWTS